MQLRPYQAQAKQDIYASWDKGNSNVMAVLPTGAGKTVLFSDVINDESGASCAIAHRQELVGQISIALNRNEVPHKIIAPDKLIRYLCTEHITDTGYSTYDPNAQCAVAGVDTLIRRKSQFSQWMNQVRLWVIDECHHVTVDNKWGKACELFPNAHGLGVTATPIRADGLGLGRHADGLMDDMVLGPSMRDLIDMGFLTDYRIFAPPNDLDLTDVNITATGDYNQQKLKKAVQKSHLVGDVVQHYMRIAPGKLGVTFATDVETATEIAVQFNNSGVPAEVVSAKTPDSTRNEIIRRFRRRELMQLVNVDLFGEGFDLPAIEVVSMARPTQSYSLYVQQFGRALRIMEGKDVAIIIDHAGNVVRHGLPDREREWSMDSRVKTPASKNPDDEIPLRYCVECTQPYERFHKYCPHCGHYPEPAGRDKPEYVDGDLMELSPETLAEMRTAIASADEDPHSVVARMKYAGAPEPAWRSAFKKIQTRQEALSALRESIAWWRTMQGQMGHDDNQSYRKFYHLFGTDVMTAQTMGKTETLQLAEKVNTYLGRIPG